MKKITYVTKRGFIAASTITVLTIISQPAWTHTHKNSICPSGLTAATVQNSWKNFSKIVSAYKGKSNVGVTVLPNKAIQISSPCSSTSTLCLIHVDDILLHQKINYPKVCIYKHRTIGNIFAIYSSAGGAYFVGITTNP